MYFDNPAAKLHYISGIEDCIEISIPENLTVLESFKYVYEQVNNLMKFMQTKRIIPGYTGQMDAINQDDENYNMKR